MKCLNCNDEMINYLVQAQEDQISYDVCEACGSFWLDANELNKMAFQVEGDIEFCSTEKADDVSEGDKNCPRCENTVLNKVHFLDCSDIILDRCGNCMGIWLDGGELDLINNELEGIMPIQGKGFSGFVNNTHLPYWYKKIRRKSSEVDFEVEVPVLKGAKLKSETTSECPSCNTKLNLYEIYKIQLEGCPACKGLWLDNDELRKLKDSVEQTAWQDFRWWDDETEAIDKARSIASKCTCPKCKDIKLLSTCFGDSKIIIDWCPSCSGTWLDRDEFNGIFDFLKSKLNNMSSKEMAKKTLEEIKEIWTGPEGTISEILDAKAAVAALLNIALFEHPRLRQTLENLRDSLPR